jgi:hypothetical protein
MTHNQGTKLIVHNLLCNGDVVELRAGGAVAMCDNVCNYFIFVLSCSVQKSELRGVGMK